VVRKDVKKGGKVILGGLQTQYKEAPQTTKEETKKAR